jgi:hypothetical protein
MLQTESYKGQTVTRERSIGGWERPPPSRCQKVDHCQQQQKNIVTTALHHWCAVSEATQAPKRKENELESDHGRSDMEDIFHGVTTGSKGINTTMAL